MIKFDFSEFNNVVADLGLSTERLKAEREVKKSQDEKVLEMRGDIVAALEKNIAALNDENMKKAKMVKKERNGWCVSIGYGANNQKLTTEKGENNPLERHTKTLSQAIAYLERVKTFIGAGKLDSCIREFKEAQDARAKKAREEAKRLKQAA